jgi:DNA repair photolyase
MQYKQIKVNSMIYEIIKKDKLFSGNYTVDSYQNCDFECIYCDSSYEKIVYIKQNAADIFEEEIKKIKKGRIIVGSVHDSYQKAERDYNITRNILKIISKNSFTCNIITKSDLVLRDIDILKKINNPYVTISIISLKESISNIFEKNVPKPKIRLETVNKLNTNGIKSGIAIIPILPFINEDELEEMFKLAKKYKANYIISKSLELKGNVKDIYLKILNNFFPKLLKKYENLYKNSYKPKRSYILKINRKILELHKLYKISNSIL